MTCKLFNDKYIIKSKLVVFFHKTRSTTFPFDQQLESMVENCFVSLTGFDFDKIIEE
jgi:hypothetical protein